MKLKIVVEFSFVDQVHWLKPTKQITKIGDLKKYVAENAQYTAETPVEIEVCRTLKLIDLDRYVKDMSKQEQLKYSLSKGSVIDGHPVEHMLDGGKFKFIMPKLIYPDDVRNYLLREYDSTLNFKPESELTPVIFNVDEEYSLRKNGEPIYSVSWRPLSRQDIVVDNKLHQIWPTNEDLWETPVELIQLLKKTNEKVY
ncbi:MAG: hypothetical protein J6Y07_04340 [Alphaproteobacteria bacterium]|nr:hypothetical protein [Alphaproteobacteria bacterium]